jgi:integrase
MTITATAPERKAVDTKTRYDGVYARHQLSCAKALDRARRCSCAPRYYGKVWDPAIGRHRSTKRVPNVNEAKNLRDDLWAAVHSGRTTEKTEVVHVEGVTFADAHTEFIGECRAGVARTKKGKRYTKKSIRGLDSALKQVPLNLREQMISAVTQGELQTMVDGFLRGPDPLSGQTIANIVNAVRSLYRWAIDREKAAKSPAASLTIPIDESQIVHRIATPGEFVDLLDAIPAEDALAWAIAAYATARRQEIEILEWTDFNFTDDLILLAGDDEARKSEAARRIVPMVKQLSARVRAEWERQNRPTSGPVFRPKRADNKSGTADLNAALRRITRKWKEAGLLPITFQDSRHTAATWLDHAGVSPKVASVMMGHKAPKLTLHPDAAPITLRRYTHVLKGELERARGQLEAFLARREAEEREPILAA